MNPSRQEGNAKILKIVGSYLKTWQGMTKDALIKELMSEKVYFLETELEYGNEDYLDELLKEIEEDS